MGEEIMHALGLYLAPCAAAWVRQCQYFSLNMTLLSFFNSQFFYFFFRRVLIIIITYYKYHLLLILIRAVKENGIEF